MYTFHWPVPYWYIQHNLYPHNIATYHLHLTCTAKTRKKEKSRYLRNNLQTILANSTVMLESSNHDRIRAHNDLQRLPQTNLLNCRIYNTLSSRPNVHRLPGIIHNLSIRHRFYSSRAITMTFRITSCPRSRKGETSQTTKRKGIKESGISRQCPSRWLIDKLETFDRIEDQSILP